MPKRRNWETGFLRQGSDGMPSSIVFLFAAPPLPFPFPSQKSPHQSEPNFVLTFSLFRRLRRRCRKRSGRSSGALRKSARRTDGGGHFAEEPSREQLLSWSHFRFLNRLRPPPTAECPYPFLWLNLRLALLWIVIISNICRWRGFEEVLLAEWWILCMDSLP